MDQALVAQMRPKVIKYNPAFLSDEDLKAAFVVRGVDLGVIIETLRDNQSSSNQHLLIVGARGSGKTSLLRRATLSVQDDPELSENWFPVIFSEESYQVTSAGELWLEAIFHLAEHTGDPMLARSHAELLEEPSDERLRERCLAILLDFADTQSKRLLFVVENFNMLTEQLSDDDAWTLRHTLQNESRIMFLGSATLRFDAIDDASKAFYEFFHVHSLAPLSEEECQAVWVASTGIQPPPGSIRPLQILTGGNLRLMTIMGRTGKGHSLQVLMADLMHLIDEHTEFFKSQLDGIAPVGRKVYLALAEKWSAATAREVAKSARLDVHRASATLGRLVDQGAATVAFVEGRTKHYQLTERLYNLYYMMRRRGAPSHRVQAAVNFMSSYYGQSGSSDGFDDVQSVSRYLAESTDVLKRLGDLVEGVSVLTAQGHAEELLQVLESCTSSEKLEPLRAALTLYLDKPLSTPREIYEVACDIRRGMVAHLP